MTEPNNQRFRSETGPNVKVMLEFLQAYSLRLDWNVLIQDNGPRRSNGLQNSLLVWFVMYEIVIQKYVQYIENLIFHSSNHY